MFAFLWAGLPPPDLVAIEPGLAIEPVAVPPPDLDLDVPRGPGRPLGLLLVWLQCHRHPSVLNKDDHVNVFSPVKGKGKGRGKSCKGVCHCPTFRERRDERTEFMKLDGATDFLAIVREAPKASPDDNSEPEDFPPY